MDNTIKMIEVFYLEKLNKIRRELLEECAELDSNYEQLSNDIPENEDEIATYIRDFNKAKIKGTIIANMSVVGGILDRIEKNLNAHKKAEKEHKETEFD